MKLEFSVQIFEKYFIEFHENPSTGSRVVLCGRTDMKKLVVALCNSANGPKNGINTCTCSVVAFEGTGFTRGKAAEQIT